MQCRIYKGCRSQICDCSAIRAWGEEEVRLGKVFMSAAGCVAFYHLKINGDVLKILTRNPKTTTKISGAQVMLYLSRI